MQIRLVFVFCLTLAAVFHAVPGRAASPEYTVEIPKLPDGLTELLASVSDCVALRETPPDTTGLLRKRMENDLDTFARTLDARGYFKARVEAELDTLQTPFKISFSVLPGPRFSFARTRLVLEPENQELRSRLDSVLNDMKKGAPYSSETVLDTETAILERLKELGHPSPVMRTRDVVADHAREAVSVRFTLDPGPAAVFGPTEILGLETVSRGYVAADLAWKEGAPFDRRLVDKTRQRLVSRGLFRSVRIDAEHDGGDSVTMRVRLLEAPMRTVRSGLWYYSDLGFGIGAGWAHRNYLGAGQELRFDADISENLQQVTSALVLPNLAHPGQALTLSARFSNEITDGYDSTNLALSGIVRQPFSGIRIGYGLAYRLAEVDNDTTRRFHLLSAPLIAELSTADHPLDPATGLTLAARMEPFASLEEKGSSFMLWNITARHYLPLLKNKTLVLATRGRYSLLAGTGRESIPEDMLLYAGGGGSIRGYAYQYAGKLDNGDEPLGGVSAVDFSMELRYRMSRTFGFVLFGDGGGAFSGRQPTDKEDYFWGVGTGLRYFTPIGPLRLDVAVPLERRDGVDAPFQLYVSLGQAF
jgi:translocation and assembly module TamA